MAWYDSAKTKNAGKEATAESPPPSEKKTKSAPIPGEDRNKKAGGPDLKKGGRVKRYARGGGIESRGKTRGRFI